MTVSDIKINPAKKVNGNITIPGDKSISHRAIMIGALAHGSTKIKNFLKSEDCLYTLEAFRKLGVKIDISKDVVTVHGKGSSALKAPAGEIYLGNSGTSMRLLSGILAGQTFRTILTGDESLSQRPMGRIMKPLEKMGAYISARDGEFPPLTIKGGKIKNIQYESPVASAQVKSAILFAGLYADGVTSVIEPAKSRDHTERMLKFFGAEVELDGLRVSVKGRARLKAKTVSIPGDISSAAFFIVLASVLKGSDIRLSNILYNKTRFGIIDLLIQMGADITIEEKGSNGSEDCCDIVVKSGFLKAADIKASAIPKMIDEIPIIMVAACFADGTTRIRGAGELRVKETDRINSLVCNLKDMGAEISVHGDDITVIGPRKLHSGKLDSFGDHRTAMSMVIAGLSATGESVISNVDCINTSFPGFFQTLDKIVKR